MSSPYLDCVKRGNNQWWRYFTVIFLSFFVYVITLRVINYFFNSSGSDSPVNPPYSVQFLFTDSLPSIIITFLVFIWLFKQFHKRKLMTLINTSDALRWQRLFTGFCVWLVLQLPLSLIAFLINPSRYSISFQPEQWFSFKPLLLIIYIVLTTGMTYVVIGYLLQGFSLILPQPKLIILTIGVLAGLITIGTTEFSWLQELVLSGFSTCFFLWITFKDNGLELMISMSLVSNLFDTFILSKEEQIFTTNFAPILTSYPPYNWTMNFIFMLIMCFMIYWLCFHMFQAESTRRQNH